MQRFIRLSLLMVLMGMFGAAGLQAKPQAVVSGPLASGDVRVLVKDSTYIIDRDYMISGTVIVEPGTEVLFYPNSRVVVKEGGRFIADGQAHATYEPGSLNPLAGSNSYYGYADPDYFLNAGVVDVSTVEELTVNRQKENIVYNVLYDTLNKVIKDLPNDYGYPAYSRLNGAEGMATANPNEIIISHEQAIMLKASRINNYAPPVGDSIINISPWERIAGEDVDVTPSTIKFIGQPTLNSSREWGHFVVLPGARAAFFRSCSFENFRKELTVDRAPFYVDGDFENAAEVNDKLNKMTNGAGGALTSLSSRTWLLECSFKDNMARLRGGAVQMLEAPVGYPVGKEVSEYYAIDKNPQVTNHDKTYSDVIYDEDHGRSTILKIDCVDETDMEPLSDIDRRAYDDARLAIYLGRVRNLTFEDNYTLISNTKLTQDGVVDDKEEVADEFDALGNRNLSAGGAMFLSSCRESSFGIDGGHKGEYMEFVLGGNDLIKISGSEVNLYSGDNRNFERDAFVANNNYSESYDDKGEGSMGGAIYLSYGTSMIFSGQLDNNSVKSPFHLEGDKARGGAIFVENDPGSRVQFRGNPAKSEGSNPNPTHITNNTARLGGAVYVDGYSENIPASPVIGGSDVLLETRDWGFDIIFEGNHATEAGGAIYTNRQMLVNGAGGVEGNSLIGYGGKYPVKFHKNTARFAGGAIKSILPTYDYAGVVLPDNKRISKLVRAEFVGNEAGIPALKEDSTYNYDVERVSGGGAIYSVYTDFTEVKGVLFENNKVRNGNGAAVAMVQVDEDLHHAWVTDLDVISHNLDGTVSSFSSVDDVFTHDNSDFPADVRMMTRFIGNAATVDAEAMEKENGDGITQIDNIMRYNNDLNNLPENGIGLGGAIFVLDDSKLDEDNIPVEPDNVFMFNRVRWLENEAYTGSAIYSDNYNVNFVLNRSLVTENLATSDIAIDQNVINGPMTETENHASSDLVSATIYGEVEGPLPASIYSEAANSMYGNDARFLIRLPDAPNTKGLLAGTTPGIGHGGTADLQGNYWGETQANVTMDVVAWNRSNTTTKMETFFISCDPGKSWLPFMYYPEAKEARELNRTDAEYEMMFTGDLKKQGPFESIDKYMYLPIPLLNDDADITMPHATSIPEHILFSGKVYDIYDKGTDIKTADYANRRMSPIEDFAVGIPPKLRTREEGPYKDRYVTKWTRDPKVAEATDGSGNLLFPEIAALQREYFAPDSNGVDRHPIGYPLYLEANVDYSGDENRTNHNDMFLNETVFFVINETNNDFIRVNLKQQGEEAPYREVFRNTVELVPDQSLRAGDADKNRYIDRRKDEGLKTLGNGADMLRALTVNPYNEDFATLEGRKYDYDVDELGLNENLPFMMVSSLFSNRPTMPTTNQDGNESRTTYFAGERYRALPVKVGDTVRVISRTKLWRIENESEIDDVMKGGLKFVVGESTVTPDFTGDIVKLQNNVETIIVPSDKPWKEYDTVVVDEFKNRIFVTEDREYPARDDEYGEEYRDSILAVTAIDTVDMYDPRAKRDADMFSELFYDWSVEPGSGVERWLSTISYNADNYKDGANGYIEFQGKPINPFVVPGGEKVKVSVENLPPTYRLIDILKAENWTEEDIANFIEIYPPYFNACAYDADTNMLTDNARYLQQDTINVGSKYKSEYEFELFVIDSVPSFIAHDENEETIMRLDDPTQEYVTYYPTEYKCFYEDPQTYEPFLIANVTDKLRFQIDINTDDECEDHSVAAQGWDYRYGMTSYGFMNIALNNENKDSTVYDGVLQTRPAWMRDEFIKKYDTEDQADPVLADFTTFGKLNVRVDTADVMDLLNPYEEATDNATGYLTSDTVFTIIANDGHSGVASKQYHVKINYAPKIVTETLPAATQDEEYNDYLNNNARIYVEDANLDQEHRFYLLYPDALYGSDLDIPNPGDKWAKDLCFPEAGEWDLAANKTTPGWLRINQNTGVLYGTPTWEDYPDMTKDSIIQKVTVLVTDLVGGVEMLSDMKSYDLVLKRANYKPEVLQSMETVCVEEGGAFLDTIYVRDRDLLRQGETLHVRVRDAYNDSPIPEIKVTPSVITSADDTDGDGQVAVVLSADDGHTLSPHTPEGRLFVDIVVTDSYDEESAPFQSYSIALSQEVDFVADIEVRNSNNSFQKLQFGTSDSPEATIGDGTNGEDLHLGRLDYVLCEYELPPVPPADVFDARWRIPLRNGTLRNIHPTTQATGAQVRSVYECTIQAGGVAGSSSTAFPVTIKWNPDDVPAGDDAERNPWGGTWTIRDAGSNGQIFKADMHRPDDPDYQFYASNIEMGYDPNNSEMFEITIHRTDIRGFVIDYEFAGAAVNESGITATEIVSVSPNPVSDNATVKFSVLDPANVTVDVLDNMGRTVTTLEAGTFFATGMYEVQWNGRDDNNNAMVSGQYMIRLTADGEVSTYPVVIVK